MHIGKDYPLAINYITEQVNGSEFITDRELVILFVDKYRQLIAAIDTLKQQLDKSQKEKEQCQKKQSKTTKSKLLKKSKKKQVLSA